MTKAERTKQFIIEKTAPVFNKKGYAGTSINDLTEATGLTKGSIYGNFENKDAVAVEAFKYNWSVVKGFVSSKIKPDATAADKLKAYVKAFGAIYKEEILQYGCPVLNTATEADDTHAELRGLVVHAIGEWYKHIEKILEQGKADKQIKKGVDAHEFAGAFIALLEGGAMLWKVTGKPDGLHAALKQCRKMIDEVSK